VKRRIIAISTMTIAVGLATGALMLFRTLSTPSPEPSQQGKPMTSVLEPVADEVMSGHTITDLEPADADAEPASTKVQHRSDSQRLFARIDEISESAERMKAELAELRNRIALVEQRDPGKPEVTATDDDQLRSRRPSTPEEQRVALVHVGVAPEKAEEIVWRRAQTSLDRLDLRDQAIREGWQNSDRYRQELSRIDEQAVSLRDEIGVDAYDAYLFDTGQNNRVAVESVIPGSAGDENGIMPGDVIETYGDQPMFDFQDLRNATSDGERGELVPVTISRGNQRMELLLPRGPIGVGLESARRDPRG